MEQITSSAAVTESDGKVDKQFVALRLAGELYGIDIAQIHTVITPQTITSVPRSPAYIRGIINLRGRVIPVVDLRARFGMPPLDSAQEQASRIVITETDGITAGLIVDGVSEVLRLSQDRIDPPSHLVSTAESECVIGIGRIAANKAEVDSVRSRGADSSSDDRLIVLLDVRKILDDALVDGICEPTSRKETHSRKAA